ncbi:AAA family ATPase [Micromonospora halophytica]|uniref:Predicted kinase n=1 Tax=Micromonospora halophytica TaxID=47864 RepID=A0A1C5GJ37_9ACTN|nr:AAA family ATPase [Micromonospora halophytica]SCG33806.1 Predicted kinase [Micromonospora halophytica]
MSDSSLNRRATGRTPRLVATRGLPASGKTTFARTLQPAVVRVNRDDLRRMLHGERLFTQRAEYQVTLVQRAQVEALLRSGASVCVDDTNLRSRSLREWADLAARHGAEFEVHDFTDVPLDECLRRDAARAEGDRVGEAAIRRLHERYLAHRPLPLPVPTARTGRPGAVDAAPAAPPEVVLVDIDGTVALAVTRSPYDMTRVGEDEPNEAVIAAVRAMHAAGYGVVFCSGRDASAREDTVAWLARHVRVPYLGLHLRAVGDHRKDAVVKQEIYEREVRDRYRVAGVFDDRLQVVRMWRSLGLTVFQVAEGDF